MYKILVVDDDTNNRMLVVNLLRQKEHYKVISAANGKMAVDVASKVIPNLILMDWEMPVMNGIEALRILKSQSQTAQIPVIMYTGVMTATKSLQEALDLGAIDFLRKPIESTELSARIHSTLQLQDSIKAKIQAEKDKALIIQRMKNQEIELKTQELKESLIQAEIYKTSLRQIHKELSLQLQEINRPNLKKLHRALNLQLDQEEEWRELVERVNKIYPKFLSLLQTKHPTLNKSELKLCVFVRLGIGRKEIATLLRCSVDTVKKNRYRLRKKIELSSSTLLEEYLSCF